MGIGVPPSKPWTAEDEAAYAARAKKKEEEREKREIAYEQKSIRESDAPDMGKRGKVKPIKKKKLEATTKPFRDLSEKRMEGRSNEFSGKTDAEAAPTGDPYEDAKAKKVGGLGKGSMDPARAKRQRAKTKKSLRKI